MLMVLVIVTLLVSSSSFPLSSGINDPGDFVSRLEEIFNKVINRALQAVQIDCKNTTENKTIDGKQVTVNSTKCVGTGNGTEILYDTQSVLLNNNNDTTSSNQNETTASTSEETAQKTSEAEETTQITASTSEPEKTTQTTALTSEPEKTTATTSSASEPEKTTQTTASTAEPKETTKIIGESNES